MANPTISSQLRTPGVRLDTGDLFLDIESSETESYRNSDEVPILQRGDESFVDRPAKEAGVSFDELVEKLLSQRMSKADNNFADVFLCLYRKFAAPGQLFNAILTRLEAAREDKTVHYLTKTATQVRIIEVVAKWVTVYPGDFARPTTRRALERFIQRLAAEPVFSVAASQMRAQLEDYVVEDDDTGWANADDLPDEPSTGDPLTKTKSQELEAPMITLSVGDDASSAEMRRPSQGSEQSHLEKEPKEEPPVHYQFHSVEDYEREAATMVPRDNLPLNKFRYHIFMDLNPDDVADEITRIDWVMFSSVRIRDLVRHVSLPVHEKEKCKSLKNVNRMINHFNHVARWVENMVLIRDKAKHRAPCLEKFMVIAQRLRKLNNYNGLAAVLAGINSQNVHRLLQTHALVNPAVVKAFGSALRLMHNQKSSSAYRLAWDNSPLPRIPFIPLHRRDLITAEQGSRTFVGPNEDRINWKKFDVLGEILLPIMKSQGTPYPNLTQHKSSRELILDCRLETDDDVSDVIRPNFVPRFPSCPFSSCTD